MLFLLIKYIIYYTCTVELLHVSDFIICNFFLGHTIEENEGYFTLAAESPLETLVTADWVMDIFRTTHEAVLIQRALQVHSGPPGWDGKRIAEGRAGRRRGVGCWLPLG